MTPGQLPQMRLDLQYTIHHHGDGRWYSVHDPLNGQYYRLGVREYKLASMFRKGMSIEDLLAQIPTDEFQSSPQNRPVTAAELTQLSNWLIRCGLCQAQHQASARSPYNAWILNPLSVRLPLVAGHRLERWSAWVTPYLTSTVVLGIVAVILFAVVCAANRWSMFSEATTSLFISDSQIWWLAALLILKIAHEMGHAIIAVRIGSNIRAAGINLMYFTPIPYVDVSDLWTIASRWKRIACTTAGILTELLIASIATIIAVFTTSDSLRYFCCTIAITGTVTTLAFNANPLMRFDGYYVLSDLLNIPNLWTRSQLAFHNLVKRILFPWQTNQQTSPPLVYAIYGGASFVYRWIITLTMAATAILVLKSFGVLLVVWGSYALCINPWIQSYRKDLATRQQAGCELTWKDRIWGITVIAGFIILMFFIPSPIQPAAPGVITFHDPVQVNANSEGILVELAVQVGDAVKQGELIAVLSDPNLQRDLKMMQLEAQSVHESVRFQQARGNLAELQSSQAKLASLQTQLNQLTQRVQRLEVRAPQDGTVCHLSVDNCLGRNVAAGESICVLASSNQLEARISASQCDFAAFEQAVGQNVIVRCHELVERLGTISQVDPKGKQHLDEPLLAGIYNGPIPVEMASSSPTQDQQWKLLAPRFDVLVKLSDNSRFVPGQMVWVRIPGDAASFASVLGSRVRQYWETLREQVK